MEASKSTSNLPAYASRGLATLAEVDAHAHVLVPVDLKQAANALTNSRITEVWINPDPTAGDIYKVGSTKDKSGNWITYYSLSKSALNRLAAAASITWHTSECKAIDEERDLRGVLVRIVYRAEGEIKTASGEARRASGEKEIDLRLVEDEEYLANTKKARDRADKKTNLVEGLEQADWARVKTDEALIQWRKNLRTRAETSAKLRVLRELLGIKQQWTVEELQHPFIVVSHELATDGLPTALRQALAARALGLASLPEPPVVEVSSGPQLEEPPVGDEPEVQDGEWSRAEEDELAEEEPQATPEEAGPGWPEVNGLYEEAPGRGTCAYCGEGFAKHDLVWRNPDAPAGKRVWHEMCRRGYEESQAGEAE